ncbi:MAG: Asp-tRNA(Asn)/Glu-tRNA(Gln) amidotransferase subunit GatA [Spirochaetes bacterium]|nr:Asp-tRNA(Asn)/Glu-tRNA(Gln) amidotransferase subunit GatA [Spirochaetota bacterium]
MSSFTRWIGLLTDPKTFDSYMRYVEQVEPRIGAFIQFDPHLGLRGSSPEGLLRGVPFAVKDILAVKGFRLTCGSRILEGFVSPYTATVVEKLQRAGAVVVGKTNMDEFGMGSSTDTSFYKQTCNPWDPERVAGGSSGGSAAAVASGMVPFALGSDTGGSVRQPAAFCGIYGLKPTYGVVSRYGLVAYASSLDVVGVCAASVEMTEEIFALIRGKDERDQTSLEEAGTSGVEGFHEKNSNKIVRKIGFVSGNLGLDSGVERAYQKTQEVLRSLGYEVQPIELSMLEYYAPVYYTIATAEASANLARYTGIRYGYRPEYAENPEELVRKARSEGFGEEVKLRILLGTFVLRSGFQDQYYQRAQRIRTAIRKDFDRVFQEVDVILSPVFPTQAFKHGSEGLDPFQQKVADRFTTAANLAGIPALSFPAGLEDGLPVGFQLMAPVFGEELLFQVARRFAEAVPPLKAPFNTSPWS